jgi:hypothetical protein
MYYGVTIERVSGGLVWRAEVRHLTPDENRGKSGVYIDAFNEQGQRVEGAHVRFNRSAASLVEYRALDKRGPLELGHGMIEMYINDTIGVSMVGGLSDIVWGMHTRHPDELGPGGEIWNSWGHHSFKVTFRLTQGAVLPPVVVPPTLSIEERVKLLEDRVTALEAR